MKFPSKITFFAVLAIILGSAAGAHAFLAAGSNPTPVPSTIGILDLSLQMKREIPAQPSVVPPIPSARPYNLDNGHRAEKLFAHSA